MPEPMVSKPRPAPPTGPLVPPPNNIKKKDPYATAWRTYSKIAEELDLLNPDGSLYPISKEAILKYLRHQSKRIKSSNLHWYVNGLKKHQENLGFPWDDIRYDDQVVALLKELTLHPVTIVHGGSNTINNSNGAINGNRSGGAMAGDGAVAGFGQSLDRQHQANGGNTSPTSQGDEMEEDFDAPSRNMSLEDQDNYQPEYMDEEPTERVALKRFASTGTLRSPARASASRVSPLGSAASIGSNSPASRNATGGPIPSIPRHKRTNGVVSSPISTVAAVIASAATAAAASMPTSPIVPGKQTVQFSEVAEVAQTLQTKYGHQCSSHPWGCVELSEDFHLELTIKMYMDWAGLVVG
ncbi:hypothetical protein BGW39_000551 [Mortierella sp. 14UC]|nr:hypothetical protein BGW39_000551 [Mortierella sp. 14UC]